MKISRLRSLCVEIYKTVAKLNPPFMQDIFKLKQITRSARNPNELYHHRPNQVTFGSKSLISLGPKIWNALPKEIKLAENIQTFKRTIKQWDGSTCNCNICNYHQNMHIMQIKIVSSLNIQFRLVSKGLALSAQAVFSI